MSTNRKSIGTATTPLTTTIVAMARHQQEITFLAGEACLYSVIKRSALSLGWRLIGEDATDKVKRNCHVIWIDRSFVNDKLFLSIEPWQRINHFPGKSAFVCIVVSSCEFVCLE